MVIQTMPTVHGSLWERIITGYSWCFKASPWRRILTSCLYMMGHQAQGTCEQGKHVIKVHYTCSCFMQVWQMMVLWLHDTVSTRHSTESFAVTFSQNCWCIIKMDVTKTAPGALGAKLLVTNPTLTLWHIQDDSLDFHFRAVNTWV